MANEPTTGQKIENPETIHRDVITGLLVALAVVVDPRKDRGKRHLLLDVLAIAVLGCLCGCDNAEALEDWAKKERAWLSGFLALPQVELPRKSGQVCYAPSPS